MSSKKVAVLMGGWSVERDVSLDSARSVVTALKELGHQVIPIDVTLDVPALVKALDPKPDVVFNALHGVGGEDGVIQGILEAMKIPYTHSGVTASSLSMDKVLARRIFQTEGIPVPPWKIINFDDLKKEHPMSIPYVVKPINEGSSKGVTIVHSEEDRMRAIKEWSFGPKVLVEKYIPGAEIQVAVIGNKAIGAIEIRPKVGFYDYDAKYTAGKADHLMPAPLSEEKYQESLDLALKAHQVIGCRGVTRSDFRFNESDGKFYLLEINTQPGLTNLSLVPEIAAHEGISFPQLVEWMVDQAQCDQ